MQNFALLSALTLFGLSTTWAKAPSFGITPQEILSHVRFLSSDTLKGRAPASVGDQVTQEYIASHFERLGLKPMGDKGTYFQSFEVVGLTSHAPKTVTFTSGKKALTLQSKEDVLSVTGLHRSKVNIRNAELVFVGYGIEAPEYQWDDFKGQDLTNKILVFLNNDPSHDESLFAGKTRLYYGRWSYKYEQAAKHKAAGAIILHTDESAGYGWQVVQTSWSGEEFSLPQKEGEGVPYKGWVTQAAAEKLFSLGGHSLSDLTQKAQNRSFSPVPLGVKLDISLTATLRKAKTANVLGLLEGSDKTLKQEAVMYMAHHDHLGECGDPSKGDDLICNGALDNATGVATVMSIARVFSQMKSKPKRSILFAAVAAEEQGLLGSKYYMQHPAVAPEYTSAVINIDGLNIWGRARDIVYIGKGKTTLDPIVAAVAKRQGRVVKADPFPDKGFFYRSDQFNLAKIGVPAAYFHSGVDFIGQPEGYGKDAIEAWKKKHYHQPSDELRTDWNMEGAMEDIRLYHDLGLEISRQKAMAGWVPGDEFEQARKESLKRRSDL